MWFEKGHLLRVSAIFIVRHYSYWCVSTDLSCILPKFSNLGHCVVVPQNIIDKFLLELMDKPFLHSHFVSVAHYISEKVLGLN